MTQSWICLGVQSTTDIMKDKYQLLLKLLLRGGTFKNVNDKGRKIYPDIDLEGITQYVLEKTKFNT